MNNKTDGTYVDSVDDTDDNWEYQYPNVPVNKSMTATVVDKKKPAPHELIQLLMDEYDAAKDDHEWEPPHPIFKMAEHIDQLQTRLTESQAREKEYINLLILCRNEFALAGIHEMVVMVDIILSNHKR